MLLRQASWRKENCWYEEEERKERDPQQALRRAGWGKELRGCRKVQSICLCWRDVSTWGGGARGVCRSAARRRTSHFCQPHGWASQAAAGISQPRTLLSLPVSFFVPRHNDWAINFLPACREHAKNFLSLMSHGLWAQNVSRGKWGFWGPWASSAQGCTDPEEAPRKGPVFIHPINHAQRHGNLTGWRGLEEPKNQWKKKKQAGTRVWMTAWHLFWRAQAWQGYWDNWMRKWMWHCSSSCKVLLLVVAVAKQKLDIRPTRRNVPLLPNPFKFHFPAVNKEDALRMSWLWYRVQLDLLQVSISPFTSGKLLRLVQGTREGWVTFMPRAGSHEDLQTKGRNGSLVILHTVFKVAFTLWSLTTCYNPTRINQLIFTQHLLCTRTMQDKWFPDTIQNLSIPKNIMHSTPNTSPAC